ncbi:MAG TPA: hypothetical protein VFZ18_14755 [Longimicrobiaceae bacterium]
MNIAIRPLRTALAGILILAASAVRAEAQPPASNDCRLEFTRANNMWGSAADSYRNLGVESITLQAGQKKPFATDWKYEKTRNDGQNYYGSHGRTYHNRGTRVVKVTIKPNAVAIHSFFLEPGQSEDRFKGDIVEVSCP